METRELSYFVKVVDEGSIKRAAEQIGISQPALTKCIRLFERKLNVKLLTRGPNGVFPTPHGESLYARAKAVVAEIARAKTELDEISGASGASLTVGTLPSQASDLLPLAAVRFTRSRPGSRLFVVERAFEELISGLRRGEFDFIVSSAGHYKDDAAFVHRHLFRDKPAIIVRANHPLTKVRVVQSRDLVKCSWVLPSAGTMHRKLVEVMFQDNGVAFPRSVIECHSASFLKSVVMHSDCVGILPSNVMTHEEMAGAIAKLNVAMDIPSRSISASYRADFPLSEGAKALIRELRQLSRRHTV